MANEVSTINLAATTKGAGELANEQKPAKTEEKTSEAIPLVNDAALKDDIGDSAQISNAENTTKTQESGLAEKKALLASKRQQLSKNYSEHMNKMLSTTGKKAEIVGTFLGLAGGVALGVVCTAGLPLALLFGAAGAFSCGYGGRAIGGLFDKSGSDLEAADNWAKVNIDGLKKEIEQLEKEIASASA